MKKLRIQVVWTCQHNGCDKQVIAKHSYDESLNTPRGMNWCQDKKGEHIFCNQHINAWRKEVKEEFPDSPWMA